MNIFKKYYKKLTRTSWHLGFVNGGLPGVFKDEPLEVSWVKSPFKDRWFADPFILDVTESKIIVLVEEVQYAHPNGVITKLTIDRHSFKIEKRETLLDTKTHLSFPFIIRDRERSYVTPENANEGKQHLYEYDSESGALRYVQTICDDCIWDAAITDLFGPRLMFTSHKSDYYLDIYEWNDVSKRFVPLMPIPSEERNSRMGGAIFKYNGQIYAPFQNCSRTYGSNLDLKSIRFDHGEFSFTLVKKLFSPHPKYNEGLHTLNEYKGVVVIDVIGYNCWLGKIVANLSKIIKRIDK